ncbi:MAG: glycosyltransferase family 2 protein, partial [Candidatus Omnitrophica bacterium]|nr:glycosyltransferase family 2 protein [Candidatus Omnitrophota bacterium]
MELSTSRLRLSIGIPTYNGSEYIREALDSIVSQLNDIEEKIEIVISDNASTDKTPMIIDEYKERYPGIFSYFRNEMDLGPDRNIDLSVRRSKGEYVWLFSDDDKMLEGSLKKVLSVLEENRNIAAIFVNWQSASLDLKQQYKIGRYGITSKSDIFCKTADDFLHTVRLTPVLLSSNIVNRSLWEKTDNSIYMGSFWIQFATLLSLLPGNSSYCISKPYVLYRYNNLR